MRISRIVPVIAFGAAGLLYWAIAQPAPQPLETLVPAGPMLYLEARDFGALIRDWDASTEKRTWTQSSNYEVFSRSRLLLKLTDAQTEFAAAAGVPADYALLQNVAGTSSALAIYDIGKLEFLYITRLPSARALNTALWRARTTYQTRRAGNVDYFVKQDGQRTAAFAYAGDLLLLGTREDVVAGALELIAGGTRPSVASESWFTSSVQAVEPGSRDLRLVYNMERLAASFQFRSHWIQGNVAGLREFSSGIADLERATGEYRERRVLIRTTATADLTSTEAPAGQLAALAPDTAGFFRVTATPTANQVHSWIAGKLFATVAATGPRNDNAPVVSEEGQAGDESDLEIRIDEVALSDDRIAQAFRTIDQNVALADLPAMLEVSSTRLEPAGVFVRPQAALVLLRQQNWNADLVQAALTDAANGIWTHSSLGAGWRTANNGVRELNGLAHLAFAVDGARLILSDSTDLVNAILARRTQPAIAGAVYSATWRHSRELANFERMMRLIDFPEIRSVPDGGTREPLFYSENIASLGRTLNRVNSASIAVHDAGSMLRESLTYRLAP